MPQHFKSLVVLPASITDVDDVKGIVSGYISSFDTMDAYGDIARKGMFTKTIQENGPKSNKPRIKWAYNHDMNQQPGVFTELTEDNFGLKYVGQTGSHAFGQDFVKKVQSGLITEHSFAFDAIKYVKRKDGVKGGLNRDLLEVKMWEGSSLDTWGVNDNTPLLGLKSLIGLQEHLKRLDTAIYKGTFTDECFKELIAQYEGLKQYLLSLTSDETTAPDANELTTQSEQAELNEVLSELKFLNVKTTMYA